MTSIEIGPIPRDTSDLTPQQIGRLAFEEFIMFGCGVKEDGFFVSFKPEDRSSNSAREAFMDFILESFTDISEHPLPSDDPFISSRLLTVDGAAILEISVFDEVGKETAVTYTGLEQSEINDLRI